MNQYQQYAQSLKNTLTEGFQVEFGLTKEAAYALANDMYLAEQVMGNTHLEKVAFNFPSEPFARAVSETSGKAAVAALAGLGLYGLNRLVNSSDTSIARSKFNAALKVVMSSSDPAGQLIHSADPARVQSLANTIFSYAPNVAGDVNLLKSLLATYVNSDGIDPSTIRSLQELEMNKKSLSQWKPGDIAFKG